MNYIVCIASEFKGNEFLEEAKAAGWHVTLITHEKNKDAEWSWPSVNEFKTVPDDASKDEYIRTIVNVAGAHPVDRVVGLDEFDAL